MSWLQAFVVAKEPRVTNNAQDPATAPRPLRRLGSFFALWTVFAGLALMWLLRHDGAGLAWKADSAGPVPLSQGAANWFRLADLNFHGVYPWILFAPYVLWLGARFRFERSRCLSSIPTHVAACAGLVWAAQALSARTAGTIREIVVMTGKEETVSPDGRRFFHTNQITVVTNHAAVNLSALARAWPTSPPEFGAPFAGGTNSGPRSGTLLWRHEETPSLSILLNLLAYLSLVGLAHAAHYYGRFRERERRAMALEGQLAKARLTALQAQLHPHFLFNALNAISTLMDRDKAAAQETLASFSELLRLALSQANQPEAPLRDDLSFLRRYVELQQTRLGAKLCFEETVSPEILDCLAPPLLLQPLVENALRHGIELSVTPGWVRVTGRADGGRVVLIVEDNGAGPDPGRRSNGGAGIGLENLRARLETLYGADQKVEFGPRPDGGARVRVEFPLRKVETK